MLHTLKTVEKLWGVKHPESRALAEKLYDELTKQILIRKSFQKMDLKLDRTRFKPDPAIVKDSFIHPKLVKKRPDN